MIIVIEVGLAIIFIAILIAADQRLLQQSTDKVRRFLDWLETASNK